ncbi:hypothetical protein Tco_0924209 [Tanacetum coccineum]|uniref:Reverse transcriptase domain-containing protein n=1 Tax=Tanacetum coccineum TaxID=301880 RepID=A0ABQ5D4L9_9ASTR
MKPQRRSCKFEAVCKLLMIDRKVMLMKYDEIQVDDKLHFIEEPVEVMDQEIKQLKRSRIPMVKVLGNLRRDPEFKWDRKDQFCRKYPHLFSETSSSDDANRISGRKYLTREDCDN